MSLFLDFFCFVFFLVDYRVLFNSKVLTSNFLIQVNFFFAGGDLLIELGKEGICGIGER